MDPKERRNYELKKDAVMVCGANRGPHNYIPVAWIKSEEKEYVSYLLCTNCFTRVALETLFKHFPEASF